ncbi:IclR family transcriptional regulator, partial [Bilophila wadsworthia]
MALADKYYTIGVLGKSFGVIELMAHQAKWELRDLAKASGLPKGTLQRILLTLCELGFVSQDGKGGAYSLTLKFFKLGQRIASNNSLVEKARPACRQLMEKVNETVNLCVAQNFDMVVMAQQVSWQILRLDSIIGSSFPIYPSASGKVHCAFLEESELLKFLNELREARPELTTDDINRFCTELAAIRREGVGFDCEEIFTGVRCVAAPIFDYTGNLVATIGCSVPTVRITEESSALL